MGAAAVKMSALVRPMKSDSSARLPPLWTAAAAVASGWGAVFSLKRWVDHFLTDTAADDFRVYYYVARLGLQQGWSHIYDQAILKAVMAAHFTGSLAAVDGGHTYPNLPTLAWIIAPLTVLPFGDAYAAWALLGLICVLIAWWIVSPFEGIRRVTLLLLALALWPVHYSLIFGQSTPEIIALVAAAWWCIRRDRALAAGLALALAASLKPQDVVLVPVCLLIAGHVRVFAWFAAACLALAAIFYLFLGPQGIADLWQTNLEVDAYAGHKILTMASLTGPGLPAAFLEAGAAGVAIFGAWRRRASLELVIAIGLAGTVVSTLHAHESDFTMLVLAAWLVMRSPIGALSRWWLLPGILAVQAMAIGLAPPVLIWELVWLGLLVVDRTVSQVPARDQRVAAPAV